MRVAVLEKFIAQLISNLGMLDQLCGVPEGISLSDSQLSIPIVTRSRADENVNLVVDLASQLLDIDQLIAVNPELVLTSIPKKVIDQPISIISDGDTRLGLPKGCRVISYNPLTLNHIFEMIEDIGNKLKNAAEARAYAQRIRAQLFSWSDNFYDRCKRKKVVFIKNVAPLLVAGEWLADMIQMTGAQSQILPGNLSKEIDWTDVLNFKPDVIIVAPHGQDQQSAFASFKILEKLTGWDTLPAVKRGEVCFSAGDRLFYEPGVDMIDSMAVIVSAIAGFESGYITKRDSFQRLRWLELQRHRF